ncbi:uncharacterized protein LOC107463344 [Arachis duranensis]|uniref:Uncharacterized protein LOC107463344 n=1 Tax=Arachis duranensis TaxID=130453 RepID=A0A6P4B7J4_ARADU|nr:uncharacterized protein LOC107463344 [Arachis duranensis]
MLPLKLLRSLVLGESINHHPHLMHSHAHSEQQNEEEQDGRRRSRRRRIRARRRRSKTAGLLFLPTREIVTDTYRLAAIARTLGMDLFPTPSLSHIIFSNSTPFSSSLSPHSTPSSSLPSTATTTTTTTCSFSCSSSSWPLQDDAVPIPFPSLTPAPLTHLRYFVNLAAPFFKLVFFDGGAIAGDGSGGGGGGNWDCCSLSMYSRVTGERVDDMEGFCRVLAGKGWTFFRTQKRPPNAAADRGFSGGGGGSCEVYLFRKVDMNRVRVGRVGGGGGADGACRVRELRLPHLDFGNAPLRILQYILLMTDDIFCLA